MIERKPLELKQYLSVEFDLNTYIYFLFLNYFLSKNRECINFIN